MTKHLDGKSHLMKNKEPGLHMKYHQLNSRVNGSFKKVYWYISVFWDRLRANLKNLKIPLSFNYFYFHSHMKESLYSLDLLQIDDPQLMMVWLNDFSTLWLCESNMYSVDIVLHIWIFGMILSCDVRQQQWGHSSQSTLRSRE